MLYFQFDGYKGFKEKFYTKDNNGNMRKNKILLSFVTSKYIFKWCMSNRFRSFFKTFNFSTIDYIIGYIIDEAKNNTYLNKNCYIIDVMKYKHFSTKYKTDENKGLCEDYDARAIRYINMKTGKVYKMKAGKMYKSILEDYGITDVFPEQIVVYLCEKFSMEWMSYASSVMGDVTLWVDDNFRDIYDSDRCASGFNSCMEDDGYYTFYSECVNASAAYLVDDNNTIVARCVIFNEVRDSNGKKYRLAERQYAMDGIDMLKQLLVNKLIAGGYIDGYKRVGAGCHDEGAFVDINGDPMPNTKFHIKCYINEEDYVSYQDSFKWYDKDDNVAYNYEPDFSTIMLDVTEGTIQLSEYDDYHEYYCESVVEVHWNGSIYHCDDSNLGDFVYIDGEYYHQEDVTYCYRCDEAVLRDDAYYSEVTEEYYCSLACLTNDEEDYKKRNWYFAEYDQEYFEDEDDVVDYYAFYVDNNGLYAYRESTIHRETLERLIEIGSMFVVDGEFYDEVDPHTMRPYENSPVAV